MLHKRLHENVYLKYETILLISKGTYKINNSVLVIKEDIKALIPIGSEVSVEAKLLGREVLIRYKNLDNITERKVMLT